MKKFLIICLAILTVLSFAACQKTGTEPVDANTSTSAPVITAEPTRIPVEVTPVPKPDVNAEPVAVTNDWRDGIISIDGVKYALFTPYIRFEENGWLFDPQQYGVREERIIQPDERMSGGYRLYSDKYGHEDKSCYITVTFQNIDTEGHPIQRTYVDMIQVGTSLVSGIKVLYDVEIVPGIHLGASADELRAALGEPTRMKDQTDPNCKLWIYESSAYKVRLSLLVYDTEGVQAAEYKVLH